jgi:hypothetical protein
VDSQNCEPHPYARNATIFAAPGELLGDKASNQIESSAARQHSASVTTCQDFFAPADAVWDALMFYEEALSRLAFKKIGCIGLSKFNFSVRDNSANRLDHVRLENEIENRLRAAD